MSLIDCNFLWYTFQACVKTDSALAAVAGLISMRTFFWPWEKVRHYPCPEGVRAVYRDLDEALPLYLADHKEKTAAAFKVAHEIEAKAEAHHEEKIKSVLFKLNSYNVSNQQHLRAAYLIYSAAPCEHLEHFMQAVKEVREFEERLIQAQFLMEQISLLITKPGAVRALHNNDDDNGDGPDQLARMLDNVLEILTRPSYVGSMIEEIRRVKAVTEEWRRE